MFAEFVLNGLGRVVLHEKRTAFSITIERTTVLTFDRAGRPYAAFLRGRNYRRSLDHRVLEKWSPQQAQRRHRQRRWLAPEEAEDFLERLRGWVQDIDRELGRGPVEVRRNEAPSQTAWRTWLRKILQYDAARLQAEGERYRALYHAVSILPPDQYQAVVIQATEGCHWNRCTFCDLYRDRPFRIRSRQEFRAHIRAVKDFLGEGLALRQSIFLGDANALIIPQASLRELWAILSEEFPLPPPDLTGPARKAWRAEHPGGKTGVYSFIDAFSPQRKTVADLSELRDKGLRRVYVGLETGHAPLLHWLNKPGRPEDLAGLVEELKAARLQVGVILLVGAGGPAFAAGHVTDSVALVQRLPLDAGDMIYLSEFMEPPHGEYTRRMAEEGIGALSPEQLQAQGGTLRAALQGAWGPRGPKVIPYDLREFVY